MGKKSKSDAGDASLNAADESIVEEDKISWEEKIKFLSPISHPLASKKLSKKIHKTIKKASKAKSVIKGVKDVQKGLRKGEKGLVILAGDVSPYDIISHIPIMCEDRGLQYCYVPSKKDLGESLGSKRQACMVLIKENESITDDYNECLSKIKEMPHSY